MQKIIGSFNVTEQESCSLELIKKKLLEKGDT